MRTYGVFNHRAKNSSRNGVKPSNKKVMVGGQIGDKVFQDNVVQRATQNLKNLKISQPRFPRKYISIE